MAKEDYLLKLSILEQEAKRLYENIQIVSQQISELNSLKSSLNDLGEKKEILANLGRGVLLKSEIKDKELFVNIGAGVVLKKSPEDVQKIIENQVKQLEEIKKNLSDGIEQINEQIQNLIIKAQKEK